jgi:uncharacterized protein
MQAPWPPRPVRTLALAAALAFLACHARSLDDAQLRVVQVAGVRLDPATAAPLVELVESGGARRTLAIWVGEFEADSIARAIQHQPAPRPNPHDLWKTLLDGIDGRVRRTVVTDLRAGTYFAVIEVDVRGRTLSVDARPSDAIAIALRSGAPVLVRESLFDAAERPDDGRAVEIDFRAQDPRENPGRAPL